MMMINLFFFFCITTAIVIVLKITRKHRDVKTLLKKLPNFRAVPSLPLLGSAFLFRDSTPDGILRTLTKFHRQYGKNLLLQELGNEFKLLTTDPRVIEQVMQTRNVKKTSFYKFLTPWLGHSSVILDGSRWSTRRKIINPAFHYKMLNDFILTMVAQTDTLVEKLRSHVGGPEFDVHFPLRYCTMDVISETAMGIQLQCQSNPKVQFVEASEAMIDIVHKRIFNPFVSNNFIYSLTKAGKRQKEIVKVLNNFMDTVIQERKQNDNAALESIEGNRSMKMTFLDLLLQTRYDGEPLPDEDIRGEVNTFMFAGHETITSCVSFALYYLSRNPTIQQKLYDEIVSVYGADGNVRSATITHASLQQLKYMEMVIKETLRMNPSIPLIGRTSAGDMIVDGVAIPAGTEVMINIYIMHNDPDQYPEPDRFLPERFENEDGKTTFSYLPFSAGIRSCIGQRYAMLEMKTILVKLLANYRLMPCKQENELQLKADLTLKPLRGAFIKILER
ncbi:cytochrome P450 4d2-like [Anopheles ziemanni]|uniref:cytochrome P450 4d2-like n=1 Tax=Anopheles coustani TaxID=139045 RepID=UPI002658EF8D|nr:cytochrome P450 4d2-like [Anopheles coustani]XP_058174506.1 cytochrome P450 4d2-like [Anopheles ziemanni]